MIVSKALQEFLFTNLFGKPRAFLYQLGSYSLTQFSNLGRYENILLYDQVSFCTSSILSIFRKILIQVLIILKI